MAEENPAALAELDDCPELEDDCPELEDDEAAGAAEEAADAASAAAAAEAAAEAKNAMHESHLRAGKNSYYYAHTRTPDGPAWDLKPEPRLLARGPSASAMDEGVVVPIKEYMWADDTAKVKVYVPLDGVGELQQEAFTLDWTEQTLSLQVAGYGGAENTRHVLSVPRLYDGIEGATMRVKPNKVIVTLTKKTTMTWSALKKSD